MPLILIGDSSLSETEKEEREVKRLMPSGRKPRPHKKHSTPRVGPRPSQRRRRMKVNDPDLAKNDNDMSLRSAFSIPDIALQLIVAAGSDLDKTDDNDLEDNQIITKYGLDPYFGCLKEINDFKEMLKEVSPSLSESFSKYLRMSNKEVKLALNLLEKKKPEIIRKIRVKREKPKLNTPQMQELASSASKLESVLKKNRESAEKPIKINIKSRSSSGISSKSAGDIVESLKKQFEPNKKIIGKFGHIYAVLKALKLAIERFDLPGTYKDFYLAGSIDEEHLSKIDSELIDSISKEGGINLEQFKAKGVNFIGFAALVIVYNYLIKDPISATDPSIWQAIEASVDDVTSKMYKDAMALGAYQSFMDKWNKNLKDIAKEEDEEELYKAGDYDTIIKIIDNNKMRTKTDVDWQSIGKKHYNYFKRHFKKVPEPLQQFASYKPQIIGIKMKKTATYHGVLQQGHPDGPTNTPWKSIDKRYISEQHFDSILKSAKQMLKDNPWFQSNWNKSASDAPYRAALDLSIYTTDDSAYQSKIDAPTYEKLLNKLASWGYDTFQDTIINQEKKPESRQASVAPDELYVRLARLATYCEDGVSPSKSFVVSMLESIIKDIGK